MSLQADIAAANARAGRDRQKVFAKKAYLVKTDKQLMAEHIAVIRGFESRAQFSPDMAREWRAVQASVALLAKWLEG